MTYYHSQLLNQIDAVFTLEEFKELCFDLDIDFDNLPGDTKRAKIKSLITHLNNRNGLPTLVNYLEQVRAHIDWRGLKIGPILDQACPYRGLFAFRREDAATFFGREIYIDRLVQEVKTKSLVALVGSSGSGKSSVVFAGLVPQLLKNENWIIVSFRPGNRPFYNLATALIGQDGMHASRTARLVETQQLTTVLSREKNPLPLGDFLQDMLKESDEKIRILLVADQFEELYTSCPDLKQRQRFLDALLGVSVSNRITLLLTLRADFLGQALSYRPFADSLQDHDIKLGPMTEDELRQAIVFPAKNAEVGFEAGLEENILREIGDEPGNLPLLQFALTELWQRQARGNLTHAAYDEIGRVDGALAYYADQIYQNLNIEQQTQARRIFTQLVQPGEGTEDTRRLAMRTDLSPEDWELVQLLADNRLVVTGQDDDGSETVEVVHEALIRRWGHLQNWMETDRAFRTWQERLRHTVRLWEASDYEEGSLLRGAPLAEAEAWIETNNRELGADEKAFIIKSINLRKKSERRRRQQLAVSAVAIMILIVLSSLLGLALGNANRQTRIADSRAFAAQSSEAFARDFKTSLLSAVRSVHITYEKNEPIVSEAYDALHNSLFRGNVSVPLGHIDRVNSAVFSPDGTQIVTVSGDGTARLWRVDGTLITTLEGHTDWVRSAAFSPDGTRVVTASEDNTARLWQADGKLIAILDGHTSSVRSAVFSPDGTQIVTASSDGTARLWRADGTLITNLEGHKSWVRLAAFSPDGSQIVTASEDFTARVWQVDGTLITTLEGHTDWVRSAAFSPDGSQIVTASEDNTARLWQADGTLIAVMEGHTSWVNSAVFSPDGTRIVTAGGDGTARLWRADGTLITTLEGHTSWVWSAAFNPDGTQIVTASEDNTARVWRTNETLITVLEGHRSSVNSATFSPDGTRIATAGGDGTARIWQADGTLITILKGHTRWVRSVMFSPDGTKIVTASEDNTARVWRVDGTLITILEGHLSSVNSAIFSPDGTQIVTASEDNSARLWQADGTFIATLEGHTGSVNSAVFNYDGTKIATASLDGTARLWQADGTLIATLEGHTGLVNSAAFSSDDTLVITASSDGTARLWQVDGTLITTLEGHSSFVNSAAFSPDDTRIVTASSDGTSRLWQMDGTLITILEGHEDWVRSATFSPNGTRIITASSDGSARLWTIDIDSLLAEGKRQLFPMLTLVECQMFFPAECPSNSIDVPVP